MVLEENLYLNESKLEIIRNRVERAGFKLLCADLNGDGGLDNKTMVVYLLTSSREKQENFDPEKYKLPIASNIVYRPLFS